MSDSPERNSSKRLAIIRSMLSSDCIRLYTEFRSNKVFLKKAIELYEEFIIVEISSIFEYSNAFSEIVKGHCENFKSFMKTFRTQNEIGDFIRGAESEDPSIYVIICTVKDWYLQSDKGQQFYTMVEIDAYNLGKQERMTGFYSGAAKVSVDQIDASRARFSCVIAFQNGRYDGDSNSVQKVGRIELINESEPIILTFQYNELFECDNSTVNKINLVQEHLSECKPML